ncbi:ABC transporter permease [Inconstantimicrobium mannanitabidum]|uniref:Uncharacterized protein n=1 Tax=Inconstantimicrobium mannanitabidum TaxID=1604901 RepID=A0ACB5RD61_9CLOT|nr:ABC transporter permease [Clostridium sp. TW13]GKX67041.1 hypothetical protein rsdtw13_22990 [Clostridium sp. TW13]
MKRKLFHSWKNRGFTLFTIVFGYFLCITILSLVINSIELDKRNDENEFQGKHGTVSYLTVGNYISSSFTGKPIDVINGFSKYGKVDIQDLPNQIVAVGKKLCQSQVIPTVYTKETDFIPNITEGRYISIEESMRGDNVAVIGKELAKSLGVEVNGKVKFYNKEYRVVGILGPEFKYSAWDKVFCISVNGLPKDYMDVLNRSWVQETDKLKSLNLYFAFRVKDAEKKQIYDQIKSEMKSYNLYIDDKKQNWEGASTYEQARDTAKNGIPIIIVALFNVLNISFFWIMDRKHEITIKKVLGATDKFIMNRIRKELLLISILSALLSFITQSILYKEFEPFINRVGWSFKLSWMTFICCIMVAIVLGYLSTIIPAKKIVRMKAAEALRNE